MTPQTETFLIERPQRRAAGIVARVSAAAVLLAALAALGMVPRLAKENEARQVAGEAPATHPMVTLVHPAEGEATSELVLPGNIEPLYSASLYARVDGYLDRRNVDIGSRVTSGQVLAVISAPELDHQLLQAQATLAQTEASLQQAQAALEQANANAELSRLTKERYVPLGEKDAVSKQEVDSAVQAHSARIADVSAATANIAVAEANVAANRANVLRLKQMQSYESIVAPFDGIITERNVERGDLVSTGNASAGKPLFGIAQSGTLRIQIDVPQSEAVNIRDGQTASIHVKERLGRVYTGTVVRSAGALNSAARTMLTEIQVDNRDGSLLPGMYAEVTFSLSQQRSTLIIPTSSLVVNASGMHVVTVDDNHTVHFLPVAIGKDMGTQVQVLKGLTVSQALVASPSDLLSEGQHVEVR
jgi:RND family efflux transporter MFP subunit